MTKNFLDKKVGLLGGGQLARMLVLKGHEMGLEMHVLSECQDDPAAQVTAHWHKGELKNPKHVQKFMEQMDVVSFESEFCDAGLLAEAAKKTGTTLNPKAKTMGLLQDRLSQKKALVKAKIPTARFTKVSNTSDLKKAFSLFPNGFVLKQRRFGYDGYGTFFVRNKQDLKKLELIVSNNADGFIAEEFIPFRRELALIFARNKKDQVVSLPLVETYQENSRCKWVKGPIRNSKTQALKKKTASFLKSLGYEGVIAFELFDCKKGLIVNEIAPRVHNSGHYSLDALSEDQFTLHLKAILNSPLKNPTAIGPGFAMLNLLGTSSKRPQLTSSSEVHLHWYGKKDNRKGRKMGHLNTVQSSPGKALSTVTKWGKEIQI